MNNQVELKRAKSTTAQKALLAVLGVALLGVGAAGFWSGAASSNRQPGPLLTVDSASLDFGEVWVQDDFQWTLPIHNPTNRDVRVVGFKTSCGCTSVEPDSFTVPAQGIYRARLHLNLTSKIPERAAMPTRDFDVQIAVAVAGARKSSNFWTVRGKIKSPCSVSVSAMTFGGAESLIMGADPPTKRVFVTTHQKDQIVSVSCDPEYGQAHVAPSGAEAGSYELAFTPNSDLPVGHFGFSLEIHACEPNGTNIATISLPVRGAVLYDIQTEPSAIRWGVKRVGEAVDETLVLQSRSGRPFRVEEVAVESTSIRTSPYRSDSASAHLFRVSAKIDQTGSHKKLLRFRVSSEANDEMLIAVPISYYGR